MGQENKIGLGNGTLYLNGEPIAWGQGELPEITVPEEVREPQKSIGMCERMKFTLTIKMPKRWRCRSRKRFIKLLMSKGISRNQAGSVARLARIAGVPYGELWRSYFLWG